jgi:hypothetical protein
MIKKSKSYKNKDKIYKKSNKSKKTKPKRREKYNSISDLTRQFKQLKTSPSTPIAEIVQSAKKINEEPTYYMNHDTGEIFTLKLQKTVPNYIITKKHREPIKEFPPYELNFDKRSELFPRENIYENVPNSNYIQNNTGEPIWRRTSPNSPIYVNAQPQPPF